jgi:hypothetical protein
MSSRLNAVQRIGFREGRRANRSIINFIYSSMVEPLLPLRYSSFDAVVYFVNVANVVADLSYMYEVRATSYTDLWRST